MMFARSLLILSLVYVVRSKPLGTVWGKLFLAEPLSVNVNDDFHPEENGDLFEGDIAGVKPDGSDLDLVKNAVLDSKKRWVGAIVPYVIDDEANFSSSELKVIQEAFDEYKKKTCIKWVPRVPADSDYVNITASGGCWSYVGRRGSKQDLSLGNRCVKIGIVIHEMMHAVGFWHEQARTDRDNYVTIMWDNIPENKYHNFKKYTSDMMDMLGTAYDYGSIMHYSKTSFAIDKSKPSIVVLNPNATIGQRLGFSDTDFYKLNKLYNCNLDTDVGIGRK